MEMKIYKSFLIILIISSTLFLHTSLAEPQAKDPSVMIGFSRNYLFPLLDGGILYFEKGEQLWAMVIEEKTTLSLISPSKDIKTYDLSPLQPTLIKTFNDDDPVGEWILNNNGRNLTIILSERAQLSNFVQLNYRLQKGMLLIDIANGNQSAFIITDVGGRVLIPAGTELTIMLKDLNLVEGEYDGEIVVDLVYRDEFNYSGRLNGRPYLVKMESIAGRVIGKIEGDIVKLSIPNLHTVGSGGIIPVRMGEAILKVKHPLSVEPRSLEKNNSSSLDLQRIEIYVVDKSFMRWAGVRTAKSVMINVREALNKTLRILSSNGSSSGISYSTVPISSVLFYEPRLNRIIENISVVVDGRQSVVVDDIAYILLSDSETAVPNLVSDGGEEISVHAYLNQFKIYSGKFKISRGELKTIPVQLHSINIQAFLPNNERALSGELKINGSRLNYLNGSGSALLPTGTYRIEFIIDDWYGGSVLKISGDTTIRITLVRKLTILDVLRIIAGLEVAIVLSTVIFIIRYKKKIQKNIAVTRSPNLSNHIISFSSIPS
ncbi:MAG: hypothetical protein RMI88_02320 [Nitrososphaerota archaeon]|nr:hypothetical protein [Nitrososphaerota archaeon]